MLDKILYFELAVFSFLTGNNDMHLKNFSMIESLSGWVLAPAYDIRINRVAGRHGGTGAYAPGQKEKA